MKDEDKTKEQLIDELVTLRRRVAESEALESDSEFPGLGDPRVEHRRSEADELKEARKYAQNIINSSLDMIIAVDEDRMVTEFNKAAQEKFGYSPEEVLGKHVDILYKDPKEGLEVHETVRETGRFTGEVTNKRKSGETFRSFLSSSILRDTKGRFIGVMGISRDITERKLEEEDRQRLNRELMEKNKELEQIVYVASHDLRSPLLNIQGFSKELDYAIKRVQSVMVGEDIPSRVKEELSVTLEEDIPEALQYILTSVSKMDSLLQGLLRLSRLGRAALIIKELDMSKLMSGIVNAFEFQIREANATLQIGELPPCRADVAQINQLFSNLLDNALKCLDPDRPGIVEISGRKETGQIVYCVEDNGIGIAARHQDRIFEIFHRLDPTAYSGEGLGLTIARRIVDRHNGKIWVESERHKGSKFSISLPDV